MSPSGDRSGDEPARGPVVCLGPFIVDILARPVTEIPAGQGGARVEEIRVTAAGTGGGTAVDLAQLGQPVTALGWIGDDELADLLVALLAGHGVGTDHLQRHPEAQTSATVLPIRPNGERPALHCPGAYPAFRLDHRGRALLEGCRALHLGGPERFTHPEDLIDAAAVAHAGGALVTLDLLASDPRLGRDAIIPLLAHVDVFCPNDDQIRDLFDVEDVRSAAEQAREAGASRIVVTCGGDGVSVLDDSGWTILPAFIAEVVDTTGCGDSVSAGIIAGLLRGEELHDAATLGMAAATLVAERLGSDGGLTPERVEAVRLNRARTR